MTNGRGAGMASFMTKKKKYKFQVEICLEELLEVPFVSAVLFAKLRLLDGGNFQDHSSRQEVQDHKVHWGATFAFPCKMMANATTGVMERCVLRISIRKECKGGRSFNKLGFVDLNLAEYAGAGVIRKKSLLEGYDARHRQDNSMLMFKIELNMISGDILFKAPSPSLKHKQMNVEEPGNEQRSDEFSSGSLAGSIASGSSGFGSLPKKRPALLSSELVIGQTLTENNVPVTIANDIANESNHPVELQQQQLQQMQHEPQEATLCCEPGHSRNSSNTSQLSKASGYSSIHSHSHSRQSSSGDSGHIRELHSRSVGAHTKPKPAQLYRPNTYPRKLIVPNTILSSPIEASFSSADRPRLLSSTPVKPPGVDHDRQHSVYGTPDSFNTQTSVNSSTDEYRTPEGTVMDVFSRNFNQLQKSSSTSFVERLKTNFLSVNEIDHRKSDETHVIRRGMVSCSNNNNNNNTIRRSLEELETKNNNKDDEMMEVSRWQRDNKMEVLRCKSEFEIPRAPVNRLPDKSGSSRFFSAETLLSFLTPRPKRKSFGERGGKKEDEGRSADRWGAVKNGGFDARTTSSGSLRSGHSTVVRPVERGMCHRKLLDGVSSGKLGPMAISPDDQDANVIALNDVTSAPDVQNTPAMRRPSVTTNPSSSSLVLSETGSLDRAKAAYERRKKNQNQDLEGHGAPQGRVEITRVNPDDLIAELLKNTNLEQTDDSAENSGLQLFIAKDGTAAVGNHEVKSQMSTGVQVFKQVVMDNR